LISLLRTNSENIDFIALVCYLDADLVLRDGEDHAFFAQFNKIGQIKYAVVAYEDNLPVACGAIKEFSGDTMEVKRMFTLPEYRGKGIASRVLAELEGWACELGACKCVLETGKKQPEGIALYKRNGYFVTPNYGQYADIEGSICFQKNVPKLGNK
jgi:putative acetyltransferase